MTIFEKIRKYGISQALRYAGRVLFHTSVIKAHYLRLNINIEEINKKLSSFDLDVKKLQIEDFYHGDPHIFNEKKLELYKKRFIEGSYQAYGIIENGRLIYSTWISLKQMGISVGKKPLYLNDNEGYLEDSYCDPIARGRGIHGKMNYFRIKKLYEAGKNRVIVIVLHGNTPAFKVQFKSGFEEIGTFHQGMILGIKFNTLNKKKYDSR